MDSPNLIQLEKAFDNPETFLFYIAWVKNSLNAGKAYHELHPEVTKRTADTLGSRALKKVDKALIMQAYGLDQQMYFDQLKAGVKAKNIASDGMEYDDHKTRRPYHEVLGKLLDIETKEKEKGNQYNQFNVFNIDKEETDKLKKSFQDYMLDNAK